MGSGRVGSGWVGSGRVGSGRVGLGRAAHTEISALNYRRTRSALRAPLVMMTIKISTLSIIARPLGITNPPASAPGPGSSFCPGPALGPGPGPWSQSRSRSQSRTSAGAGPPGVAAHTAVQLQHVVADEPHQVGEVRHRRDVTDKLQHRPAAQTVSRQSAGAVAGSGRTRQLPVRGRSGWKLARQSVRPELVQT